MTQYKVVSIGGSGGSYFEMAVVQSLTLHTGKLVDSIIINNEAHGGSGGSDAGTIKLSDGEYITRIDYRSGKYVDYLKFTTNKGQVLGGGGTGGTEGTIIGRLIAITGHSGSTVDQLSFLVAIES